MFFDNLIVTHNSGPLLKETHYYPFGLTMAGLSSKALKGMLYPENKRKYNGIELDEEFDINEYEAFYRTLDPQTGRWGQVDPKVDEMEAWSPYASNFDNPVKNNDFLGDEPDDGPGILDNVQNAITNVGEKVISGGLGVANSFFSNNVGGVGRTDVSQTGLKKGNAIAYQIGQKLVDALSIYTGAIEDFAAGGGEVFTFGGATAVALPVAIHGTTTIAVGLKNLLTNPVKNVEGNTPQNIPKPRKGPGTVEKESSDPKRNVNEKTKDEIHAEQKGNCAQCETQTERKNMQFHHVNRHSDGVASTRENVKGVCKTCHVKLHQ